MNLDLKHFKTTKTGCNGNSNASVSCTILCCFSLGKLAAMTTKPFVLTHKETQKTQKQKLKFSEV